jgi:acyl-coenzyme A synthetase/AMP-(fatty) acid ligase
VWRASLTVRRTGWIANLYNTFGPLGLGATYVIQAFPPGPLTLDFLVSVLAEHKVNAMGGSPPFYNVLAQPASVRLLRARPLPHLRNLTCGGDILSQDTWRTIKSVTGCEDRYYRERIY